VVEAKPQRIIAGFIYALATDFVSHIPFLLVHF